MTPRLPALRPLTQRVRLSPLIGDPKRTVAESESYLLAHQAVFARIGSADELGVAAYERSDRDAGPVAWHLTEIRRVLLRALWSREIFVSASVVDELLYYEFAHAGATDPLLRALERIRDARMTRPGMLVFPLHSFGILGAGLVHAWSAYRVAVIQPEWGIAIAPQTNSLQQTLTFLDGVRATFGIKEHIPHDLIEHWSRSRPTDWLKRNPLLAVRAINVPGYYYDNEFLLISRVRAVAAMIGMLASLQPSEHERGEILFSSARLNSWQTQDLHHYLVFYAGAGPKHALRGDCVPIHSRPAITEASDLNVDLDAIYWSAKRQPRAEAVKAAMEVVYRGFLAYAVGYDRADARARTYRKVFESLTYFKRSFSASDRDWQGIVSLATAFEMLLTDSHAHGVGGRLASRTQTLLKGTRGTRSYQQAVRDLYEARSQIVHSGRQPSSLDLHLARRAYALVFCSLVRRFPRLRPSSAEPIRDLLD